MCEAVDTIVAAARLYDFPDIAGKPLYEDPPMYTVRVSVPDAKECTLGIDDVPEIGEVWCSLQVPAEQSAAAARLEAVHAELAPCLPDTSWRLTSSDAAGWRFANLDNEAIALELRLEPNRNGTHSLILRVRSSAH